MKLRHNKKRNTAFLYEVLVKKYTVASINKDAALMSEIKDTIRSFFSKGKTLNTELSLYRTLSETAGVDTYTAKRLLEETRTRYQSLDQREIFNEQTKLISWINKNVGRDSYNAFISNYKTLATISQYFDTKTAIKESVAMEKKLITTLIAKPEVVAESNMEPMDNLVYKTVIKNFNEKYSQSLSENQKNLIQHFVFSFQDEGIGFVSYVNEEVTRIKNIVESYEGDDAVETRMESVLGLIESFKTRPIDKDMLEKVLKLQSLAEEIENGDHD